MSPTVVTLTHLETLFGQYTILVHALVIHAFKGGSHDSEQIIGKRLFEWFTCSSAPKNTLFGVSLFCPAPVFSFELLNYLPNTFLENIFLALFAPPHDERMINELANESFLSSVSPIIWLIKDIIRKAEMKRDKIKYIQEVLTKLEPLKTSP